MAKINKIDIERFNTPIDETTIYNPLALVAKAEGSKIWIVGEKEPYFDFFITKLEMKGVFSKFKKVLDNTANNL